MKAILTNNEDVTLSDVPPDLSAKLSFEKRPGRPFPVAYLKKGTELEGEQALIRVRHGQAMPADEECRKACGMTSAELAKVGRTNAAALAGITGEKDTAMFLAGAIDGYAPGSTDANPKYIQGPNWKAWQDAEKEVTETIKADPLK